MVVDELKNGKPDTNMFQRIFLLDIIYPLCDPNLCSNAIEYTNNHRNKYVVEIAIYFINQQLKPVYIHNRKKLARVLVAYL